MMKTYLTILLGVLFLMGCSKSETFDDLTTYLGAECYQTEYVDGNVHLIINNSPVVKRIRENADPSQFTYSQYLNISAMLIARQLDVSEVDSVVVKLVDNAVSTQKSYSLSDLKKVNDRFIVSRMFCEKLVNEGFDSTTKYFTDSLRQKGEKELTARFYDKYFDYDKISYYAIINQGIVKDEIVFYNTLYFADGRKQTYIFFHKLNGDDNKVVNILFASLPDSRSIKFTTDELDFILGVGAYEMTKDSENVYLEIKNSQLFSKMKDNDSDNFSYEKYAGLASLLAYRAANSREVNKVVLKIQDDTVTKEFSFNGAFLLEVNNRLGTAYKFANAIASNNLELAKTFIAPSLLSSMSEKEWEEYFNEYFGFAKLASVYPRCFVNEENKLWLYMDYVYAEDNKKVTCIFIFLLDKDNLIYGGQMHHAIVS